MAADSQVPSTTVDSTQEPPSGIQGKGTADSPYDQGNAPETAAGPGIEPPSGQQGKGTIDSAYDQGNQPENKEASQSPKTPALPTIQDPLASPSTTHQGSGNPLDTPSEQQEAVIEKSRGRDETSQRTTSTMLAPPGQQSTGTAANGGDFDASKPGAGAEAARLRKFERSVSPGQMPDGSHVRCSGDRGEGYTPGSTMDKLKERFHFGKRH